MKKNIKDFCNSFMNITQEYVRRTELSRMFYCLMYLLYLNYKYKLNYFEINIQNEITIKEFLNIWKKESNKGKTNFLDKERELLKKTLENLDFLQYTKIVINNLFKLMTICTEDFIKKIMREDVFGYFNSVMQGAEFSSSNQNVELATSLLNIKQNDNILDMCSGIGNFLTYVYSHNKYKSINGIEINELAILINEIRLTILEAKFTIINEDVLTCNTEKKYEKIFSEYPLRMRIDKYKMEEIFRTKKLKFKWEKIPANSTDWIVVNTMLTNLKENGKAVTIIPDGPLFKTADNKYKQDLLKNHLIEAIIRLPKSFNMWTGINLNMIVFSSNNEEVNMVDASNEETMQQILELYNAESNSKKRRVPVEEILENECVLTVNNYINVKKIKYHNPKKLSQYVIDIFRGYQLIASEQRKLEDKNGKYEILTISNIEDGIINDDLVRINSDKNIERYLVEDGDIIISSKGTRIKIAVANVSERKIIANGNLIVLRVDKTKINPYFLAMYLNSEEGRITLKQIQTGTVIISINPSRLKDIKISTFDIKEQEKMVKEYLEKQKQYIVLKKQLEQVKMDLDNFYDNEIKKLKN